MEKRSSRDHESNAERADGGKDQHAASSPEWEAWEERLRAADPARLAPEPDLESLRRRLPPFRPGRGARFATSTARAAAASTAAVLALLLLGGGFTLGRSSVDPVAAPPSNGERLNLSAPATSFDGAGGSAPVAPQAALGAPDRVSASVMPGIWWPDSTELRASPDLPDASRTATGYRLAASGRDGAGVARDLARALGLRGQPQPREGGWEVSDAARTLWVSSDPLLTWSYSNPANDPWACASGAVATPLPAPAVPQPRDVPPAASGSFEPGLLPELSGRTQGIEPETTTSSPGSTGMFGAPSSCPPADIDLEAATRLALEVTAVASPGSTMDLSRMSEENSVSLTARPLLDGMPVDQGSFFTFGPEGLAWASGHAGVFTALEGLPVLGARSAIERSALMRWRAFGPYPVPGEVSGGPMPLGVPDASAPSTSGSDPSVQEDARQPGVAAPIEVPLTEVEIFSASPALVGYTAPDGTWFALPGYQLSSPAGDWLLAAVAEEAVQFTSAP